MTANRVFEFRIVWLIAFITIICYFDRSAISFAIVPIEKELSLNSAQFGFIASGFGIGYFAMIFFAGILVERFNYIQIWAYSAVLWSLATLGMGIARGFTSFLLLRILLGIAEAIHFPALLKCIADWLEHRYRARALSIGLVGVPLASLIGAPLITILIESLGWRKMFAALSCLGFFWAFFWLLSFRGKKNPKLGTAKEIPFPMERKIPWKGFFHSKLFFANCLIYLVFGYIVFFALIWLPGYLEKIHHLTLGKTGFLVMLPWLASSALILAGGWISDALMKRKPSQKARTLPIAIGMFLASASFFLLLASKNLSFDLWMISFGLGFSMFINAPLYALNADLFPQHAGAAQGIASLFFAFAGIASPSITGLLVQVSGSFQSAILLVAILSAAAGFIALRMIRPKAV
jgi:MFS family permease